MLILRIEFENITLQIDAIIKSELIGHKLEVALNLNFNNTCNHFFANNKITGLIALAYN